VIVGNLAAIATPSLASQKPKALDAEAKVLAHAAQTAAETIATDNSGSYEKVTTAELHNYEASIGIVAGTSEASLSAATGAKSAYSVTAKATDGNEYKISKKRGRGSEPQVRQPGDENRMRGRQNGHLVARG
jgi:type II secretory pathway pseudopilin PulG